MKTVYDLHRFWTSMSAIFGFTFHIGRMTEVLTPDIYIYRAHWLFQVFAFVSKEWRNYMAQYGSFYYKRRCVIDTKSQI